MSYYLTTTNILRFYLDTILIKLYKKLYIAYNKKTNTGIIENTQTKYE